MINGIDKDLADCLPSIFCRPGMYLGTEEDTEENRKELISIACLNAAINKMRAKLKHNLNFEFAYETDGEGFPIEPYFKSEEIHWMKAEKVRLEKEILATECWKLLLWGRHEMPSSKKN